MYEVSDRFNTYINRSGRRTVRVTVLQHTTVFEENVPIVAGTLTYDRNSDIKSNGSITLASTTVDWTNFEPWGMHFFIECGLVYPDGEIEYVPMGRFHIEDYTYKEGVKDVPTFTFYDRLKCFDDINYLDDAWGGKWASDAIINIFRPAAFPYGDLPYTWGDVVDYRLPGGSVFTGSDLQEMLAMVRGAPAYNGLRGGGDVYMDRNGGLVINHYPLIDEYTTIDDCVADYSVGINLFSCSRQLTRDGVFNSLYVKQAPDAHGNVPFIFLYDSNPASRTYYYGPFNRKTRQLDLPNVSNVSQAIQAGQEQLFKALGLASNVTFTAPLNPALELGDLISLYYFDSTVEIHQVESITMDLVAWTMEVKTSSRQILG